MQGDDGLQATSAIEEEDHLLVVVERRRRKDIHFRLQGYQPREDKLT